MISRRGDVAEDVVAAVSVLTVATVALFLVSLVAAASFVVVAQRRLRQLGMLAAVGATEKQIRLVMVANGAVAGAVAAVAGTVVGVAGWIAARPTSGGSRRLPGRRLQRAVVAARRRRAARRRHRRRRGVVAGPHDGPHPARAGPVGPATATVAGPPLRRPRRGLHRRRRRLSWPSPATSSTPPATPA